MKHHPAEVDAHEVDVQEVDAHVVDAHDVDPWRKAAECARAIEIVADPERRRVLSSLRNVWLALGSQPSFRNRAGSGAQMSTLAQIHHELMSVCRNAMH